MIVMDKVRELFEPGLGSDAYEEVFTIVCEGLMILVSGCYSSDHGF